MYKLTSVLVLSLIVAVACQRKTAPAATQVPATPSVPLASAEDLEAGRLIYSNGKCIRCHAAKPVENWTVEGWQPILRSMIPKAKLDSVQKYQLTAYVNAHAKK